MRRADRSFSGDVFFSVLSFCFFSDVEGNSSLKHFCCVLCSLELYMSKFSNTTRSELFLQVGANCVLASRYLAVVGDVHL